MDRRKLRRNAVPIEKEIERFLSRVLVGDDSQCWEWIGRKNPDGYGRFDFQNTCGSAHRYMWELHNGVIPDGLVVCHKCDNPPCVNPSHLFLGTVQDNVADRDQKGRTARHRGADNGRAVLDETGVREIKNLRRLGHTYKDISSTMGVSVGCVSHILNGRHWAWVEVSESSHD